MGRGRPSQPKQSLVPLHTPHMSGCVNMSHTPRQTCRERRCTDVRLDRWWGWVLGTGQGVVGGLKGERLHCADVTTDGLEYARQQRERDVPVFAAPSVARSRFRARD